MTKKPKQKEKTDAKNPKQKQDHKQIQDELQQQIDDLSTELKQQKDKLIRCLADFDNYKKRMSKERQTLLLDIKKHYLLELLDIKELLLQAIKDTDPKNGLRILLNQLEQFFDAENIKYIDCIKHPFDHTLHDAKATVDSSDGEENIVIDEIKKGYMVDDVVLRPSHVVVSKKKCEEESINE